MGIGPMKLSSWLYAPVAFGLGLPLFFAGLTLTTLGAAIFAPQLLVGPPPGPKDVLRPWRPR